MTQDEAYRNFCDAMFRTMWADYSSGEKHALRVSDWRLFDAMAQCAYGISFREVKDAMRKRLADEGVRPFRRPKLHGDGRRKAEFLDGCEKKKVKKAGGKK